MLAKDGRVVWVHSKATLVPGETGRPRFWQGVALDVTAQKLAEESTRAVEPRFAAMAGGPLEEARAPRSHD